MARRLECRHCGALNFAGNPCRCLANIWNENRATLTDISEPKTRLKIIKDKRGIVPRKRGQIINYTPWHYKWQGMSEAERTQKGIFVHCFGHGEFEVLTIGQDIELQQ